MSGSLLFSPVRGGSRHSPVPDKHLLFPVVPDKALDDIYKESTGIPRRINRICEKSLMYASQQGKRLIDEHLVRYIIEHEMLGGDTRQ